MSIRKFLLDVFARPRDESSAEDPDLFHVPSEAVKFNRLVMQASWEEAQAAQRRWEALVAEKKNQLREQRRTVTPIPPPRSPVPPSVS